jgi:hypothetical protein
METGKFPVNHEKEDRQDTLESAIKKDEFKKSAIYACKSL